MQAVLPAIDRELVISPAEHTSFTGDRYARAGYTTHCATQQTDTPHMNYAEILSLVPEGHRISALDEISYLVRREAELKGSDGNPRDALKDPLFARQIESNPYRWNWTHVALRAPEGKNTFPIETDGQGRKYGIGNYVRGDKVIAEGIRIPVSQGSKVVAMNTVLLIPAEVSDGNEPQHTTHWYFDPEHYNEKKEVAVRPDGGWGYDGRDWCLALGANVGRSYADSNASFRLFQGSLDEFQLPTVEYYVRDRESYERGLADGIARGLEDGVKSGVRQERERISGELSVFLDKLKQ